MRNNVKVNQTTALVPSAASDDCDVEVGLRSSPPGANRGLTLRGDAWILRAPT